MASSYTNMFVFMIVTLIYFLKKPKMTLDDTKDPSKYTRSVYMVLGIYFLAVTVLQWVINVITITSTCGGSIAENIGSAGLYTVIPWTFIFGVVILTLIVFPGFKSAFSDVIGYYYISFISVSIPGFATPMSVNGMLTELLVDKEIDQAIEKSDNKSSLQDAADMIIKICGNKSILINQMQPDNFESYWKLLNPLMKPKYKGDGGAELKKSLFDMVVTRDNVGEMMWYIYTGILLSSIVQMKLASRRCASSPATMEKNYQSFLETEQKKKEEELRSTDMNYVIAG